MVVCNDWTAAWPRKWRKGCASPPEFDNTVHLWRVPLGRDSRLVRQLFEYLSPGERQRASGFRLATARASFIVRRGMLRKILGRYLNVDPRAIRLGTSKFGKPYLRSQDHGSTDLSFSITHSHKVAIVALAPTDCIGVDLEYVQPLPDLELMIETSLSSREKSRFRAMTSAAKLELFYRHWTCKEAYLKALGVGLNRRPDSFGVALPGARAIRAAVLEDTRHAAAEFSILSFEPFAGYVAATATTRKYAQHQLFMI